MEAEVEGYVIPLHRSLTQRQLMAGVPPTLVILNATMTLAAAMAFASVWVVPVGFALHLATVSVCREDPELMEVLAIYLKQAAHLRV